MSNSLAHFDNDGIELIINTDTGESFASQSGYSRMSTIDYPTIRKRVERLNAVTSDPLKTTQVLTNQGVQEVTLITEDMICEWLPKDNPDMATKLLKLGVRMFLHKLAGFEIKSNYIELKPNMVVLELPEGHKPLPPEKEALLDTAMLLQRVLAAEDDVRILKEKVERLEDALTKHGDERVQSLMQRIQNTEGYAYRAKWRLEKEQYILKYQAYKQLLEELPKSMITPKFWIRFKELKRKADID